MYCSYKIIYAFDSFVLKMEKLCDENQQAFKDPLHVPVGPITKARTKKIK